MSPHTRPPAAQRAGGSKLREDKMHPPLDSLVFCERKGRPGRLPLPFRGLLLRYDLFAGDHCFLHLLAADHLLDNGRQRDPLLYCFGGHGADPPTPDNIPVCAAPCPPAHFHNGDTLSSPLIPPSGTGNHRSIL